MGIEIRCKLSLKFADSYGEPEILSEGIEIKPPALIPTNKVCIYFFFVVRKRDINLKRT